MSGVAWPVLLCRMRVEVAVWDRHEAQSETIRGIAGTDRIPENLAHPLPPPPKPFPTRLFCRCCVWRRVLCPLTARAIFPKRRSVLHRCVHTLEARCVHSPGPSIVRTAVLEVFLVSMHPPIDRSMVESLDRSDNQPLAVKSAVCARARALPERWWETSSPPPMTRGS